MYGIFTYIWLILMVNVVGEYAIHGSHGLNRSSKTRGFSHSWLGGDLQELGTSWEQSCPTDTWNRKKQHCEKENHCPKHPFLGFVCSFWRVVAVILSSQGPPKALHLRIVRLTALQRHLQKLHQMKTHIFKRPTSQRIKGGTAPQFQRHAKQSKSYQNGFCCDLQIIDESVCNKGATSPNYAL